MMMNLGFMVLMKEAKLKTMKITPNRIYQILNNLDYYMKSKNWNLSIDMWEFVKETKIKDPNYDEKSFEEDQKILNNFDTNIIWNKKWWKLGLMESICACACPLSTKIECTIKRLEEFQPNNNLTS